MAGSSSPRGPVQCSRGTRVAVAHMAMSFVVVAFSVWNVLGSVIIDKYCAAPGDDINCPVVFACYREVGAAPVLLIVCAFSRGFVRLASRRDLAMIVGAGVSRFGIQLLGILGIAWTNADVAAFYQPANPVTVVLLALIFRMEAYHCSLASALKVIGVLVTVGGIVLIVLDGEEKCKDLNATVCVPVRANLTLCNGTLEVDGPRGAGDGSAAAALVNASTECCRTCESASDSDLFAVGNVVLACSILCSSLYTIFQKQLIDPSARSSSSGGGGDASGGGNLAPVVGGDGDDGERDNDDKTMSTTTAVVGPRQQQAAPVAYRTITIITYAYCIAAVCMATLTGILRPPAHLFAIAGAEAAAVACVTPHSCLSCLLIALLPYCLIALLPYCLIASGAAAPHQTHTYRESAPNTTLLFAPPRLRCFVVCVVECIIIMCPPSVRPSRACATYAW